MKTLYLIRHSLTAANEQRLYCGSTDLPLSENGKRLAAGLRLSRPLPDCEIYATSGMRRATETLALLTGKTASETFPDLREMDFGAFEMHGYEQLKGDPDYIRWIEDKTGDVPCPGGESSNTFVLRVTGCVGNILCRDHDTMMIVCHGGVIANIMQRWFPGEDRHFYSWQPSACGGYSITVQSGKPVSFETIQGV